MTQGEQRQDLQCSGPCSLGGVSGEFLYPLGLIMSWCVVAVIKSTCRFVHLCIILCY